MLFFDRLHAAVTRNRARTRPDHPDPRLRGRVYDRPAEEVWAAVRDVVRDSPRWREVGADLAAGEVHAESVTAVIRFTDDVRIRIDGSAGSTRVDLASASRVGRADFGVNARRIAQFLQRLDHRLGVADGPPR